MNYNCVIFDLDNTLYDEMEYFKETFKVISEIINDELQENNQKKVYKKILSEFLEKGTQFPKFFNHVAKLFNLDNKFHDIFFEIHKRVKPNLVLYKDVRFIINWLKERKLSLGLITNGTIEIQRNKINLLNLDGIFDYICVARELGTEKPDSLPYKTVLEKLKTDAKTAIYIGDNPYNDFQGPKEIKITAVRLLRGEFKDNDTNNELIDYFINDFYELQKIIEED